MKRKDLFVCLLIAVMLIFSISTASATGEKETEAVEKEGPIEITFWSLFTGGDGEFFDAMVDEFKSDP